mmetsp:Transcript_11845/g.13641  ORF Transcript_11845/g.13641 Transcript_11845/m.13641 type:complete len:90 (+) Transcript_11845:43-312(+)
MESRSYNFSTARKRSTQLAASVIKFPREDDNAPRTKILRKECPSEYDAFKICMKANGNDENKCWDLKQALEHCSVEAFKKVNSDPSYEY